MFAFDNHNDCIPALVQVLMKVHSLVDIDVNEPCSTWQDVLTHTLGIDVGADRTLPDVVSTQNAFSPFPEQPQSGHWVPTTADAVLTGFLYLLLWALVNRGIDKLV